MIVSRAETRRGVREGDPPGRPYKGSLPKSAKIHSTAVQEVRRHMGGRGRPGLAEIFVLAPAVAGEHQDALGPGVGRGLHIFIAVAHQIGTAEVQVQVPGRLLQQRRGGFAAGAALIRAVEAGIDAVQMGAPGRQEFFARGRESHPPGRRENSPGPPRTGW